MKTVIKTISAAILAIAMSANPVMLGAQNNRRSSASSSNTQTRQTEAQSSSSRRSSVSSQSSAPASSSRSSVSSQSSRSSSSSQTSRSSSAAQSQSSSSSSRSSAATQTSRPSSTNQTPRTSTSSRSSGTSSTVRPSSSTQTSRTSGTSSTVRSSSSNASQASRPVSSGSAVNASSSNPTTQNSYPSNRRSAAGSTPGRVATSMNNSPSSNQPAQSASRSSSPSRQSANYSAQKGLSSGVKNAAPNDSQRRISNMDGRSANMRIDNNNVLRIPPRERDRILDYDRPANFYVHDHHYFGYRIHSLPPSPHHFVHWGVDYYYYNHVYYRPWGGVYVVCRPPFGVCIDIALTQASLCAIRFSYFNNVYRTYREIDDNYRLIDQQNRTIAQNNALIASQNAAIALNANRAATAYELADRLGLVQSYANSTSEYFYEDGVFFIENSKGQYEVIVPPAGALVSELPDDYETITLDGTEFYKVDDTVYRLTLVDGTPYLEVLGQMTSRVAKKYGF